MFLLETVPKAPGEYPLTLKRFNGIKELSDKNLQYAILSHTWDEDEVVFADISAGGGLQKKGYEKVYRTLDQAWRDGYAYVWVDSCCIDKSSSAELSEAINSMYAWYEAAAKCYAYLADVPLESDPHAPDSRFCSSRWFTRGWTLQELLAPTDLVFFSQDWKPLNDKIQLREPVSRATRIDADILAKKRPLESASIAERMSWAAGRETTRTEDKAYCLMGIFSVNMPMLYGEGDKAFLRLQEEIMKQSDDHSLFAWANSKHKPDMLHGLLADSPDDFNFPEAQYIVPYSSWEKESPYGMTNRGLDIELHMRPLDANNARYIAALHCPSPTSQGYFLAVVLQRLGSGADSDTYARIECHKLQTVSERGKRIPVFIPQTIAPQDRDSVYPLHIFQLSGLPVSYCLTQAMRTADFDDDDRRLMPSLDSKRSFKILKKAGKVAVVLLLTDTETNTQLAIRLGSSHPFKVGFDAVSDASPDFTPLEPGCTAELATHRVRVDLPERVIFGVKVYHVCFTIQRRGWDGPSARVARAVEDIAQPHLERVERIKQQRKQGEQSAGPDRKGFLRNMGLRR